MTTLLYSSFVGRAVEIDLRGRTWPCAKLHQQQPPPCRRCTGTAIHISPNHNRCKTSDSFAPMVRLSIRKLKSVPIGAMSTVKQPRSTTAAITSTCTGWDPASRASGPRSPKRRKPPSICSGRKLVRFEGVGGSPEAKVNVRNVIML